jgi:hypothetical protein
LGGLVWLDVLDLQPLFPTTNLLTVLLTRVREALECRDGDQGADRQPRSLLEEGAKSARSQLSRLINDATVMWADIRETDTRDRANREMAVADTYADFNERFEQAMRTLAQELGRFRSCTCEPAHIVLPIDNIDRSTQHLNAIVKLAQLVSSDYLWLVMAGERQDVETFLERAYWQELITAGGAAAAVDRERLGGEGEALGLARRQAAAAFQKLIPPSHRIEVKLVTPAHTLDYSPGDLKDKSIRALLDEVAVLDESSGQKSLRLTLIDLMEPDRLLRPEERPHATKATDGELSFAAKDALRLPARGVLDLWQVAYGTQLRDYRGSDLRAERITRTMLRNLIGTSSLSNKSGHVLQEQIIRRSPGGGTVLDFSDAEIEAKPLQAFGFEYPIDTIPLDETSAPSTTGTASPARWLRSRVQAPRLHSIGLRLDCNPVADSKGTDTPEELPAQVAGWLIILYDILMLSEDVALINPPTRGLQALSRDTIDVAHELAAWEKGRIDTSAWQEERLSWETPLWDTFLAHDLFTKRWERVRTELERQTRLRECRGDANRYFCFYIRLEAAWIACTLWTFSVLMPMLQLETPRSEARRALNNDIAEIISADAHKDAEAAQNQALSLEKRVYRRAAQIHTNLVKHAAGSDFASQAHARALQAWLEASLPMLLSHAYLPLAMPHLAELRLQAIGEALRESSPPSDAGTLLQNWQREAPMLLTTINEHLKPLLAPPAQAETLPPAAAAAGRGEEESSAGAARTELPKVFRFAESFLNRNAHKAPAD